MAEKQAVAQIKAQEMVRQGLKEELARRRLEGEENLRIDWDQMKVVAGPTTAKVPLASSSSSGSVPMEASQAPPGWEILTLRGVPPLEGPAGVLPSQTEAMNLKRVLGKAKLSKLALALGPLMLDCIWRIDQVPSFVSFIHSS